MGEISILGCGWLGLPLGEQLVGEGQKVRGSTTTPARLSELAARGIEPFRIDLGEATPVDPRFLDAETLIVAVPHKVVEDFRRFVPQIADAPVRNVLFISSTSVYAAADAEVDEGDGPFADGHPLQAIENLFRKSPAFRTTVLRLAGLVGPDRHPGRFFRGGRAVPNPDGYVNMIHRDDAIGIIAAILSQGAWEAVFNGCADAHPTRGAFYTRAAELMGAAPPPLDRKSAGPWKIVSNARVRERLSYRFRYPEVLTAFESEE